jgi:hypothetical protein
VGFGAFWDYRILDDRVAPFVGGDDFREEFGAESGSVAGDSVDSQIHVYGSPSMALITTTGGRDLDAAATAGPPREGGWCGCPSPCSDRVWGTLTCGAAGAHPAWTSKIISLTICGVSVTFRAAPVRFRAERGRAVNGSGKLLSSSMWQTKPSAVGLPNGRAGSHPVQIWSLFLVTK